MAVSQGPAPDTAGRPSRRRAWPAVAVAALVIVAAAVLAAASHVGTFMHRFGSDGPSGRCSVPALPGRVVSVRLVDMGAMVRRHGSMIMMDDWRSYARGMMRLVPSASSVPHGTVSLRVANAGSLTHELVVLPLAAGRPAGARAVGTDGRVAETGSLGEASATCAAGAGSGIAAGARGWVSLRLPPGRYELVCNLPGHYTAGMFAELDVT